MQKPVQNTFFYDGTCGFCNSTVLFLLDRTAPDRLSFCSLQSSHAETILRPFGIDPRAARSSYLYDGRTVHRDSSAILHALWLCGAPASLAAAALIVPRFLRDWIYDRVAANRHRLSRPGKVQCRLLTPAERQRFQHED